LIICDFDISLSSLVQAAGRAKRLGQKHAVVDIRTMVIEDGFDHFLYTKQHEGNVKITHKNIGELEWFVTSSTESTVMNTTRKLIFRIIDRNPVASELSFPYFDNAVVLTLKKTTICEDGTSKDHVCTIRFQNGNFQFADFESYMFHSDEDFANVNQVKRARKFLALRDFVVV
jgi:hypothetical protein